MQGPVRKPAQSLVPTDRKINLVYSALTSPRRLQAQTQPQPDLVGRGGGQGFPLLRRLAGQAHQAEDSLPGRGDRGSKCLDELKGSPGKLWAGAQDAGIEGGG